MENEKSALDDLDETGSKWYQSLNGTWDFKWAEKPADRENDLRGNEAKNYKEDWDTEGWDKYQFSVIYKLREMKMVILNMTHQFIQIRHILGQTMNQ